MCNLIIFIYTQTIIDTIVKRTLFIVNQIKIISFINSHKTYLYKN